MKSKKKNSNYKIKFEPEKKVKKPKGKVFLITFVCIFLSLVLIAGIIITAVSISRDRKTVAKYQGATLTEAELKFFASLCKYDFLATWSKYGAADTPEFFNSSCPVAKNFGELLEFKTKQFITQIVAGNYIFDKYSRLTDSDKTEIEKIVNDTFVYRFDSSEEKFNEEALKFGFSYDEYKGIITKFYKYTRSYTAFYAANYQTMTQDEALCASFYSEYSKVKLLFINTEKDYKYDSTGTRITEGKNFVYSKITGEEKEKRLADAELIRQAIAKYGTDESGQISDTMFENYVSKYPSPYGSKDQNGFYLHDNASYTAWLKNEQLMVVNEALLMEPGTYKEVKTEQGVCFIYKDKIDVSDFAYLDTSSESCFLDFFQGLVKNEYEKLLLEIADKVELREAYNNLDLIAHPKLNNLLVPRI